MATRGEAREAFRIRVSARRPSTVDRHSSPLVTWRNDDGSSRGAACRRSRSRCSGWRGLDLPTVDRSTLSRAQTVGRSSHSILSNPYEQASLLRTPSVPAADAAVACNVRPRTRGGLTGIPASPGDRRRRPAARVVVTLKTRRLSRFYSRRLREPEGTSARGPELPPGHASALVRDTREEPRHGGPSALRPTQRQGRHVERV